MTTPAEEDAAAAAAAPKPEPQTFSREYVHELREENKSVRVKAKADTEAAEKRATDAAAAEKAAKDAATAAKTAADDRILRAELKAVAIKAGMVDVDGLKLADLTKVKLNDKGEVEGGEALIEDLKKNKPYLFGQDGTNTSAAGGSPKPADAGAGKKATEMTKEEYDKAKGDLLKSTRR